MIVGPVREDDSQWIRKVQRLTGFMNESIDGIDHMTLKLLLERSSEERFRPGSRTAVERGVC